MESSYGGTAARMTLQFGIYVIQIAVLILITYANSFVMKNRSRELGVYSLLGMEKKHLLVMTFFELCVFYLATVGLGILSGLTLDKMLRSPFEIDGNAGSSCLDLPMAEHLDDSSQSRCRFCGDFVAQLYASFTL